MNDLCGMVHGLDGDGDDIEIGSDYPQDNIPGPPTLG